MHGLENPLFFPMKKRGKTPLKLLIGGHFQELGCGGELQHFPIFNPKDEGFETGLETKRLAELAMGIVVLGVYHH